MTWGRFAPPVKAAAQAKPAAVQETDISKEPATAPASSATQSGRAQTTPSSAPNRESPQLTRVINAFITRETQLIKSLPTYSPRMEIYIQNMRPDPELGPVPEGDYYFLGRVQFQRNRTIAVRSMLPGPKFGSRLVKDIKGPVTQYFKLDYSPTTFYFSLVMDNARFDRQHYDFELIRQEFLGDVRCLVFDVKPKRQGRHGPFSGKGGVGLFEGRIWVEDRDYNVVRFNGTFGPAPAHSVYYHFDSWRENVQPGLWLPAYAYSEESDVKYGLNRTLRFRAQLRFWGYGLANPDHPS